MARAWPALAIPMPPTDGPSVPVAVSSSPAPPLAVGERLGRRATSPLHRLLYFIVALGSVGVLRTAWPSSSEPSTATAATATTCDCRCRVRPLQSKATDPGEINRLRRQLAAKDPACYRRHLPSFRTHAKTRLKKVKRHLSLHIPKAGGTSLCELVKQARIETDPQGNCWEYRHFFALWADARFAHGDREQWRDANNNHTMTCDEIDRELPRFVMNENYLDRPLCIHHRLHSILLRDPIERVRSNEKHLMTFQEAHNRTAADTEKRLALVRRNYVTWALAVGTTEHGKRGFVTPTREHLTVAKDALSRFDFLMELSRNATCENAMLRWMGLGPIPHLNAQQGAKVALPGNHSREQYAAWNELDMELHEYARGLMELDCEFFLGLQ